MSRPGINSKPFEITLENNCFNKGDILQVDGEYTTKLKVIKTYPFNWWRKLLFRLGFKIKSCDLIKVKEVK